MNDDLSTIFKEFAGKEVSIKDENDPVLKAMREKAAKNNLSIRVLTPGSIVTMDYRPSRVNVDLVKKQNGKWSVPNTFRRG